MSLWEELRKQPKDLKEKDIHLQMSPNSSVKTQEVEIATFLTVVQEKDNMAKELDKLDTQLIHKEDGIVLTNSTF